MRRAQKLYINEVYQRGSYGISGFVSLFSKFNERKIIISSVSFVLLLLLLLIFVCLLRIFLSYSTITTVLKIISKWPTKNERTTVRCYLLEIYSCLVCNSLSRFIFSTFINDKLIEGIFFVTFICHIVRIFLSLHIEKQPKKD